MIDEKRKKVREHAEKNIKNDELKEKVLDLLDYIACDNLDPEVKTVKNDKNEMIYSSSQEIQYLKGLKYLKMIEPGIKDIQILIPDDSKIINLDRDDILELLCKLNK